MANRFTKLREHVAEVSVGNETHYADFPFRWIDNMPFDYVSYDIAGKRIIGTAVRYSLAEKAELNAALKATAPAFSLRYESSDCLVYGDILIDINDWVSQFVSDWQLKFGVMATTADIDEVGSTILDIFCKVVKLVRQQKNISGGKAFIKIEECFGLSESNEVILIKAPTGTSFQTTIQDLGRFAEKLKDEVLLKIGGTATTDAVKKLTAFQCFVSDYVCWSNMYAGQKSKLETLDYLALHHTTSLDDQQNLRFFMNVGRLCQGKYKLCSNWWFQQYLNSNITKSWTTQMCNETYLRAVFHFPRQGNNPGTYAIDEIAIFCLNALKHYGESVGLKISKANVLQILCGQVDDLAHHLFSMYAISVVRGSYNSYSSPPSKIFTTDI